MWQWEIAIFNQEALLPMGDCPFPSPRVVLHHLSLSGPSLFGEAEAMESFDFFLSRTWPLGAERITVFFFVGLTGYGSKLVAPKKRQLTVKMKWNDIKWHKMTKNMWSPWSLAHLQWKWPWRWRKITILLKTSLYIYRASKFGDASTFKIALKESMDFLGTEIVGKDTDFLFLTWGITVLHHRNGMVQAYWVLPFGWLVVPNSQGRKIVESCSI